MTFQIPLQSRSRPKGFIHELLDPNF